MANRAKRKMVLPIMIMVIAAMALPAQASAGGEKSVVQRTSTSASSTAKDQAGNKYKMTGIGTMSGKSITVTTSYTTTLYKNGTHSADSLKKTLSVRGSATFSNSASYVGSTVTGTRTGGSGSLSKTYSNLAYDAKSVTGEHSLSCNGGSTSGVSFRQ